MKLRTVAIATVLVAIVSLATVSPAHAASVTSVASTATATTESTASSSIEQSATAVASDVGARSASPRPAINWYGCPGLVGGARSLQVAAFALGYCPSVWFLQATPPGRALVNAIVNGACRVPWIVRAATLGKFSTC